MKIRFFYLLTIILLPKILTGQELPVVVHQSPNVAAFSKYGDIPVSYYTGVPNISIPVYTVKSGEIEVPINLSYHTGGIQVSQEASWVGLGWSLSQGGSISRTVRGSDDFNESPLVLNSGYPNEGNLPEIQPSERSSNQYNFSSPKLAQYFSVIQGFDDPAPDAFSYNILGYSGTFIMPKNNGLTGFSVMQNGLLFEYIQNEKKWIVTDGNGWKFYINVTEETLTTTTLQTNCEIPGGGYQPCNSTSTLPKVITSWHLTEAITPKGDKVTFIYKNGYGSKSTSKTSTVQPIGIDVSSNLNGITSYHPFGYNPHKTTASISSVEEKYLDKIEFATGYVKFNTEDRTDLALHSQETIYSRAQRLRSIEVFNLNDKLIKKVEFSYDYFNSTSGTEAQRLRLNQVQESYLKDDLTTFVTKPPYVFEYNTSVNLPSKTSKQTDHWGYYTSPPQDLFGVTYSPGSPSAYPLVSYTDPRKYINYQNPNFPYSSNIPSFSYDPSTGNVFTNMQADTIRNQAAMLKSIQYPTGGKTKFTFETNDYYNLDDHLVEGNVDSGITDLALKKRYRASDYIGAFEEFKTKDFTLNQETLVILYYVVGKMDGTSFCFTAQQESDILARVLRDNGTTAIQFAPYTPNGCVNEFEHVYIGRLAAGNYTLETRLQTTNDYYVDLSLEYTETIPAPNQGHYLGGGLRIKKIENYTKENELAHSKLFKYRDEFNQSTGKLLAPISYVQEFDYSFFHPNSGNAFLDKRRIFSDNSLTPMGSSAQGKSIGYDRVIVTDVNHLNQELNGRKEYYYKNNLETVVFSPSGSIPNDTPLDNGQLLKEEHYNNNGSLIFKKTPHFIKDPRGQVEVKGINVVYDKTPPSLAADVNYHTNILEYSIKSEWWYMDSQEEIVYDLNGQNPVAKTTNYTYGSEVHMQPTVVASTNSKGESTSTTSYYPSDNPTGTAMSTSLFNDMVSDHILNPVLKQETVLNGVKLGGTITNYTKKINSTGGDMYLPATIESLKKGTTSDYEERLSFIDYDSNGHILEVKKTNGSHISYIWGYNKQYPVAKIENATRSQIESLSGFGSDFHSGTDGLSASQELTLRNSLSNAMVTTYLYNPLIGVTSTTDPKGYTMYYEYDEFNRLKQVKDAAGKILSKNQYHYKGQQ